MLVTNEYPETVTAAQIIADNLAPLGITVNIRTVDFATWLDEQNSGHFDMLMMGWLGNIDPDDYYYAQHRTGGTSNAQKYSNPEVDRLLDAGRVETNKDARAAIYRKAATIIADECSYIYLYNPSVIQAWNKDMSGYEARRDKAIRFRTASISAGGFAMTSSAPRARATRFASNPVVRFVARRLLYSVVVMLGRARRGVHARASGPRRSRSHRARYPVHTAGL